MLANPSVPRDGRDG